MTREVLAEGHMLFISTMLYREQVAYAPDLEARDVLTAYKAFFHETEEAANAAVDEDEEEFVLPVKVMTDGSVVTEWWTRSAAEICQPYHADVSPSFMLTSRPSP